MKPAIVFCLVKLMFLDKMEIGKVSIIDKARETQLMLGFFSAFFILQKSFSKRQNTSCLNYYVTKIKIQYWLWATLQIQIRTEQLCWLYLYFRKEIRPASNREQDVAAVVRYLIIDIYSVDQKYHWGKCKYIQLEV